MGKKEKITMSGIIVLLCVIWVAIGAVGVTAAITKKEQMAWFVLTVLIASLLTEEILRRTPFVS